MIVRKITAKIDPQSDGNITAVYAAITNAAGNCFCQDTATFEPRTSQSVSRNSISMPVARTESRHDYFNGVYYVLHFATPFPASIVIPGAYQVHLYLDAALTQLQESYGRLVRTPDADTLLGHYTASQPPPGAAVDTSLYATRSLVVACPLNAGAFPFEPLRPRSFVSGYGAGFEVTKAFGKSCALITPSADQNHLGCGYPLRNQNCNSRTWTLMGSISPVVGEDGILLQFGGLFLSKNATGYVLHQLGGLFDDVVIPAMPDGFHRWVVTYQAGTPSGYSNPILPVLCLYCDGQLLTTFNVSLGRDRPTLALGQHPLFNPLADPTCPAYHENYFFHRRALTAAEVEQDALTPYQWYVRPKTFPPSSVQCAR